MKIEDIFNIIDNNINENDKFIFSLTIADLNYVDTIYYSTWLSSHEVKYIVLSLVKLNKPIKLDIYAVKSNSNDYYLEYSLNQMVYSDKLVGINNMQDIYDTNEIKIFDMEFKLSANYNYTDDKVMLLPSCRMRAIRYNYISLAEIKKMINEENICQI